MRTQFINPQEATWATCGLICGGNTIGCALLVVVGVERCGGVRAVHKHSFCALAVEAVGDGERVCALHHGCHLVEGVVGEAGSSLYKVAGVLHLHHGVFLVGVVGVGFGHSCLLFKPRLPQFSAVSIFLILHQALLYHTVQCYQ